MLISDWSSDVCSSDLGVRPKCAGHVYRHWHNAGADPLGRNDSRAGIRNDIGGDDINSIRRSRSSVGVRDVYISDEPHMALAAGKHHSGYLEQTVPHPAQSADRGGPEVATGVLGAYRKSVVVGQSVYVRVALRVLRTVKTK